MLKIVFLLIAFSGVFAKCNPIDDQNPWTEKMIQVCENNHNVSTTHISETVQNYVFCLKHAVDGIKMKMDFSKNLENSDHDFFKPFMVRYCPKFYRAHDCLKDFIVSFEECFEADVFRKLTIVGLESDSDVIDFMCDNDGNNTVEFIKHGGKDCITNHQAELMQCYNRPEIINKLAINDFKASVKLSPEICSAIDETRDCIENVFKKCDGDVPYKLIQQIIHLKKDYVHAICDGKTKWN